MTCHYLPQYLLVILLVYSKLSHSKVHEHYITPLPDEPCPQNSSCLTLSEFAANSSYNEADISVSLLFLPGNHILDREVCLSSVNNVSMTKSGLENETAFINCPNHSGRLYISESTFVSISDLHFIGCGNNKVTEVEYLTIVSTTFQSVKDCDSVLMLNQVSDATIIKSSFSFNFLQLSVVVNYNSIIDRVYYQESLSSGVLYTSFSNVSIISSEFINNRADIGGVLVAQSSNLYLAGSTISNNTANFGGVMVTSRSTISIVNDSFSYNEAHQSGGVMVTYNDTGRISSSNFSDSFAAISGGVMITFGESSFDINSSTFKNNSAGEDDGALYTSNNSLIGIRNSSFNGNTAEVSGGAIYAQDDSSFDISNSTFDNNRADFGGVIATYDNSSYNISSSKITNNDATYGGVLYIYDKSSFNISKSTFNENSASVTGGVIYTQGDCLIIISNSEVIDNNAYYGGFMGTFENVKVNIRKSTISRNYADFSGGVIHSTGDTSLNISHSILSNNSANYGGAIRTTVRSSFNIRNSTCNKNTAYELGGAIYAQDNSSFDISNSTFNNNSANIGGVMATHDNSLLTISSSKITNNNATYGGVLYMYDKSSFNISKSTLNENSASVTGGVILIQGHSLINISNSEVIDNSAYYYGGFMGMFEKVNVNIRRSTINRNSADLYGGVIYSRGDTSLRITHSILSNNSANYGGIIYVGDNSSVNIFDSCKFNKNTANLTGGVIYSDGDCLININNSEVSENSASYGGFMGIFDNSSASVTTSIVENNTANYGGAIYIHNKSSVNISNCSKFNKNTARWTGGVIYSEGDSLINIGNCEVIDNSAYYGGLMGMFDNSSFSVSNSVVKNNTATLTGGVLLCTNGTLHVDSSSFNFNRVVIHGGGVFLALQCSTVIANSTFQHNIGSLYTFSSNFTLSGYLKLETFNEPLQLSGLLGYTNEEGGAITSFQSAVIFSKNSNVQFSKNQGSRGSSILATESTIMVLGEITIENNRATSENGVGGGISLRQSHLEIRGECKVINNTAIRGGGIHASSSTVAVYPPGNLQVIGNSAELGGGMYLEINPKLYVLVSEPQYNVSYFLNFSANHATYGGALYVVDEANSGACSPNTECFIQTLALYIFATPDVSINTVSILFSGNSASEQGPNLFGGLLDRCISSQFAEVYQRQRKHYSGVSYLTNISNIDTDSISSQPVRVCFHTSDRKPDCSYQHPAVRVQKGEAFNVSVVAVDQINHTVNANISAFLSSFRGRFGEGQTTQFVNKNSPNITLTLVSPHKFETLNLYANGPCGSATLSTSRIAIQFTKCTCPVGFETLSEIQSPSKCECVCNSNLSPYITDCSEEISSVFRTNTNSWIKYVNDTDPPDYVIYPNCPFDYCHPQTTNITINFNLPNGADSQCAFDRTGVLCGACKNGMSLSLASSRCVTCHTYWPAVFVIIILAAAIAGILLVTALLALNMTVSVGLINSFILYANIVSAGSSVFFPSSEPSFPSVFVAWLNLDIGIDVCFIDGLDAYTKTWLQLAFPLYIISLVVIVIIASEFSSKFAKLIGKKNPISTLATLILLSFAKLLSVTITVLSSAILYYPNGKREIVWLPDGNVPYFQGKHIPLALVAILIIIIGLPYTILLLLWQWIVRTPKWKIFNWTTNTKLNNFIVTYHVPYNSKYRCWTGLLLMVRVVLYITASATVSTSPQSIPLLTNILVVGLLVLSKILNQRNYKSAFVDVMDTILSFNLLALSVFTLFDFKTNVKKQAAVAYTSTIITLILFIMAIFYHVFLLVKKAKYRESLNKYPLAPAQPASAVVTRSFIELPANNNDECQNAGDRLPEDHMDCDEQEITKIS